MYSEIEVDSQERDEDGLPANVAHVVLYSGGMYCQGLIIVLIVMSDAL